MAISYSFKGVIARPVAAQQQARRATYFAVVSFLFIYF